MKTETTLRGYTAAAILSGLAAILPAESTIRAVVDGGAGKVVGGRPDLPLALVPERWKSYLSRRPAIGPSRAGNPVAFGQIASELSLRGQDSQRLRFPGNGSIGHFNVRGWLFIQTAGGSHAKTAGDVRGEEVGPVVPQRFSLAILAVRRGDRFVQLLDLSGKALIYFCAIGGHRLTILLNMRGKVGQVECTHAGGPYFYLPAVQQPGGQTVGAAFGYYKRTGRSFFRVEPRRLIASACRHSTSLNYDAFQRVIRTSLERSSPAEASWTDARFGLGCTHPKVVTIEQGAVVFDNYRSYGATDSLFKLASSEAVKNMPHFNISAVGLRRRGFAVTYVGPSKFNRSFLQALAVVGKIRQAAPASARMVGAFLKWVGGGAAGWYASPGPRYVRATIAAALTPIPKAWNVSKGRLPPRFINGEGKR